MSDEWIVRVADKEFGPVDFETLQEWRAEGRLIPTNEVRRANEEAWVLAREVPELFPVAPPVSSPTFARETTLSEILARTWRIYRQRFGAYCALTALVTVPAVCAQISAAAVRPSGDTFDLGTVLAGLFNFAMTLASFVVWPIYLAGLQIVTADELQQRATPLRETITRATRFWPRVAVLCIIVYSAFFLVTAFAFAILLMLSGAATSSFAPLFALLALGLLFAQIWMFSRVFVGTLFWQQTAVLENARTFDALRRSHALGNAGRGQRWFQRPAWRGGILASIWFLVVIVFTIVPEWSLVSEFFRLSTTMQDPQAIVQAMSAHANAGKELQLFPLAANVVLALLRPLLGISFVILFFAIRPAAGNDES